MSDFIYEIHNSLSSEFCKEIIDRFEKDENKHTGLIHNSVRRDFKCCTELGISSNEKWKDIDEKLYKNLKNGLDKYFDMIKQYNENYIDNFFGRTNIIDSGYKIQKYSPGGFFKWHSDYADSGERLLAYIWYLNNVKKDDGGATEFYNGRKVQPTEGTLLFFPTTWIHYHRGCELLKGSKYIITGFIINGKRN